MNTGPGNAPRTGPRRKARRCGASTAAPLPPAIPNTLFPVFPQPAPSPRTRVYAVLSPPLHPPTLWDSPCPSRQRAPRGPRMHTTFPLAHSSQHHPSVLSPRPVPPDPAVSAAILPPNSDSPLPLPTAPEQLLHPCNRSGKCLPHLPPNRSPPSPTLRPPRLRAGGAVGCTGGCRSAGCPEAPGTGGGWSGSGLPGPGRPPAWPLLRPPQAPQPAPPAPAARHSRAGSPPRAPLRSLPS